MTVSHSVYASDFHSPRTAALGGAGHAGPLLNDPIYLNPSFSSFLKSYSIGYSYAPFDGGIYQGPIGEGGYHGRTFNFSVLDGRSELFQAGVGYTVKPTGKLINFGASKGFLNRFSAGLGVKFYLKDDQGPIARDTTLALTGIMERWLQVAFIADNIFQTDTGKERGLYREFIAGTKFNVMSIFMVYVDPHLAPDLPSGEKFGYEAGLEFTVFKDLFLRVGKFKNSNIPNQSTRGGGHAFGVGWISPRISFDYALKKVNDYASPNDSNLTHTTAHHFGLTLYL